MRLCVFFWIIDGMRTKFSIRFLFYPVRVSPPKNGQFSKKGCFMRNTGKVIFSLSTLIVLIALAACTTGGGARLTGGRGYTQITDYDVVVIGGGGTGLVAAIAAADEGARVLILERMAFLGGATGLSSGLIPASGTQQQIEAGIEDTYAALALDILRPAMFAQDHDLVLRAARGALDFIEWSTDIGVNWTLETHRLFWGQTTHRIHEAEGSGWGLVSTLADAARARGITVMLETTGTGLLIDRNGAVIGATASNRDGNFDIRAGSVILATSGFAANSEMVNRYIPVMAHAIPYFAPGATGDGIIWGMALGGAVRNMTAYQAFGPVSSVTTRPIGQAIIDAGAFLLNKNGNRFLMEITGYSELGAQIVYQPGHNAWMIWDSNIAGAFGGIMNTLGEANALFQASTPEDLARQIGLTEAQVRLEFDRYLEGIARGEDYMNRTKLPSAFTAPFFATMVTGDFRHTQGGLVIDQNAQVVREDGSLIPNLFAGGGVTEGFSTAAGPAYTSGNGLLQAFVFGHTAGISAARNAR